MEYVTSVEPLERSTPDFRYWLVTLACDHTVTVGAMRNASIPSVGDMKLCLACTPSDSELSEVWYF